MANKHKTRPAGELNTDIGLSNSGVICGGGGGSATNVPGGMQQEKQNIQISGINADSLISGDQLVDALNAALPAPKNK